MELVYDLNNNPSFVDRFRCQDVYVYTMGQEPWVNYVMSVKYTEYPARVLSREREYL